MDLTPKSLKPQSTDELAQHIIREAREPMRREIAKWLALWGSVIPKNAAEQMKAIRDAHESGGER